jgi:predicted deacylase
VDRTLQTVPSYKILTYAQIASRVVSLATTYPTFIKVTTAQKRYGLPAAGGYANHIVTIQDYAVHPVGSASSNALPEVFLSGALHGDERVGPTAVVETAGLLARAAACESNPTAACKTRLASMGVNDSNRQWLARLVTTRRIVIVPTPNALGYAQGVREEGSVDPNRDFAFDQNPNLCMRSIAGRAINEVFREHQFQLSITFHGGMEVRVDE